MIDTLKIWETYKPEGKQSRLHICVVTMTEKRTYRKSNCRGIVL